MQIPKTINGQTYWITEPDYQLETELGEVVIKLDSWGDCWDHWSKLGKPDHYAIRDRKTQAKTLLDTLGKGN